jgi:predicted membrane protein
MFKSLIRVASLALLGWLVFVAVAAALAATRQRQAVPQDLEADQVDLVAVFGPLEFTSVARAFRGGSMTTWFGGSVLDLRGATLDPAGATLRVSTMFGGGNVVVPEGWNVDTKITACFGGAGDARPAVDRGPDAPTLRLEGVVLFGGWGITSEPAGEVRHETVTA